MTLGETLVSVWQQVLVDARTTFEADGKAYPLKKTRRRGLRTIQFRWGPYDLEGIEQNPETNSRWAALAREGKRVMQFSFKGRYIGNVAEGELLRYPAWKALRLPE